MNVNIYEDQIFSRVLVSYFMVSWSSVIHENKITVTWGFFDFIAMQFANLTIFACEMFLIIASKTLKIIKQPLTNPVLIRIIIDNYNLRFQLNKLCK